MRPTNSPSDRVDRNKRNKKKKNLNIKNNNNDPVAGLFSSNFPIYWNETQSKNPTKTEPVAVRAGEGDVSLGHGRRRAAGGGRRGERKCRVGRWARCCRRRWFNPAPPKLILERAASFLNWTGSCQSPSGRFLNARTLNYVFARNRSQKNQGQD